MVRAGTTDKGGAAEEALANYFRQAGFLAIRSIPFQHDGEDLTDIDVWLYERGSGLERRRYIVDAKNKARAKLVERLLWTAGLREALAVDGAFVFSSGLRDASRRLARRLKVTVLDVQALGSAGIDSFVDPARLPREDVVRSIGDIDRQRESKAWRQHMHDMLAALLTSFGGSGANVALRAAGFFASQSLSAAPSSASSILALRLFYLAAACAAAGLDYVAAQSSFQSADRRLQDIEDSIRYGTDHDETKNRLDIALELARQYLPNGAALANQMREKIAAASEAVPADMIAEVVAKLVGRGALFEAARALEAAAHANPIPAFGALPTEAKTFVGAVLDFLDIDREQFASLVPATGMKEAAQLGLDAGTTQGPR